MTTRDIPRLHAVPETGESCNDFEVKREAARVEKHSTRHSADLYDKWALQDAIRAFLTQRIDRLQLLEVLDSTEPKRPA